MSSSDQEKTERIRYFCIAIVILGFFMMIVKSNSCALACSSCDSRANIAHTCKDQFYTIDNNNSEITCESGAKAEIVTSPPAPKAGVICHCTNSQSSTK